jgi:3D (Asp-Asp-Asp) domain-containing protein
MRHCSHRVGIALLVLACAGSAQAGTRRHQDNQEMRVVTKTLDAPITYRQTRNVGRGQIVKGSPGKPGYDKKTYKVIFKDGKPVSKDLVKEERLEPIPGTVLIGTAGFASSRGSFFRSRVLEMRATSYDASVGWSGRTATGRRAEYGVAAVDPRVIPLGSMLYVEGYGLALACDTGGAIKGNRIDLCFDKRSTANAFGTHRVIVHILR